MLRLHELQLNTLDRSATAAFLARLLTHLRTSHAASASLFDDDELRALGVAAIGQAQQLPEATEASIVLLVDIWLTESAAQRRRPG